MSNLLSGNFPFLTYRNLSLGVTGQIIKAFKGQIFSLYMSNTASSAVFVKLYDKATAPTASDTPTHTLTLQANQSVAWGVTDGIAFITGISARASTVVTDADNTAPSTNQVVINVEYL